MQQKHIDQVKEDAEHILRRIEQLEKASPLLYVNPLSGNKYVSALRRSSMELTRSLAEMRKPSP